MVDRLREKQYQLAAQKRNEAILKYNLYQQTAKYFERENRIAKHYDSWNLKVLDHKEELEKSRKAERLQVRRNKLRYLLKNEEEVYKKEVDELKTRKNHVQVPSLDLLKEKLKEKRAEQGLYFPKTCRRYQSYFVCPTEQTGRNSSSIWATIQNTNNQQNRLCRDSTNLLPRDDQNSRLRNPRMSTGESGHSRNHESHDTHEQISSHRVEASIYPNPKYSARYSRKSLENTNVRTDNCDVYVPTRRLNTSFESIHSPNGRHIAWDNQVPMNGAHKENYRSSSAMEHQLENSRHSDEQNENHSALSHSEENEEAKISSEYSAEHSDENRPEMTYEELIEQEEKDEVDRCNVVKDNQAQKKLNASDTREFESEKSLPWLRMDPTDKNLSKQMFLYLTHRELKLKIEDLSKRESHACTKQSWDEALRLRDMRNRLDLIREKRLYNTEHLELNEDVRKIGLDNIRKREEELASREFACMDSTMYSEEAKALWKKWVHEDENSVIKDARAQRETLMNSLEKEWQSLAIQDKDKISRSFEHVMSTSDLQEEHKMTAALSDARMKSFSTE